MSPGIGVGVGLPFVHLQRRGGFSPASLFSSGEEGAWYDPSDLSTLWQDAAGTTPVTAADQPVGRIDDKSGNGNHATQSTAGSRPMLRTSGGLWYLESDGVDDVLVSAGLSAAMDPGGVPVTLITALDTQSDTQGVILSNAATTDEFLFIYQQGSSDTTLYVNASGAVTARKNGNAAAYSTRGDGYTLYSSLAVVTAKVPNILAGWESVGFGKYGNSGFRIPGLWYQIVIVLADVTGDNLTSAEAFVGAKAGVSF